MCHHTDHHPEPRKPNHTTDEPYGKLIWTTILYLGTALIAAALYREANVGLVPAVLIGFATSAAATATAYTLARRTHS